MSTTAFAPTPQAASGSAVHLFYHGPLSNWHPSRFTVAKREYNCGEQWLMAWKAWFFGDERTAEAIMAVEPRFPERGAGHEEMDRIWKEVPRRQKALGRQVRGFSEEAWKRVARDIMFVGLVAKCQQNPDVLRVLAATRGLVAEASPTDTVWGIGMAVDAHGARNRILWPGQNWLGEVLTTVRDGMRMTMDGTPVAVVKARLLFGLLQHRVAPDAPMLCRESTGGIEAARLRLLPDSPPLTARAVTRARAGAVVEDEVPAGEVRSYLVSATETRAADEDRPPASLPPPTVPVDAPVPPSSTQRRFAGYAVQPAGATWQVFGVETGGRTARDAVAVGFATEPAAQAEALARNRREEMVEFCEWMEAHGAVDDAGRAFLPHGRDAATPAEGVNAVVGRFGGVRISYFPPAENPAALVGHGSGYDLALVDERFLVDWHGAAFGLPETLGERVSRFVYDLHEPGEAVAARRLFGDVSGCRREPVRLPAVCVYHRRTWAHDPEASAPFDAGDFELVAEIAGSPSPVEAFRLTTHPTGDGSLRWCAGAAVDARVTVFDGRARSSGPGDVIESGGTFHVVVGQGAAFLPVPTAAVARLRARADDAAVLVPVPAVTAAVVPARGPAPEEPVAEEEQATFKM